MPSGNGAQIGGLLEDMNSVMARLSEAGTASSAHASDVSAGVQTLQNEVNDITAVLTNTFIQLADNMRQTIARAHDTLVTADWSGQSRGAADAAEAQLNGDVSTTLEAAQTGVESLGSALRQQVESFYLEVTGQFSTVMTNIEGAYSELSRGTQMFADSLVQADQTISFGG